MCGITGYFTFQGEPPDLSVLSAMCDVIYHRGPDEEGLYRDDFVALGIRRLRVIDLATGKQPISNETGQVWVVFNGELYNYRILREELVARGHVFRTQSDTEVIVHAYEEWGTSCLSRFAGMFAFAIWDLRHQTLLLARDPLGIKPLYLTHNRDRLIFGSELKTLAQYPDFEATIDPEVVSEYFTFGMCICPNTILKGTRQLNPGEFCLVDSEGTVRYETFWTLRFHEAGPDDLTEATEALRNVLRDSVRDHLVSDVPLGAFLSGGVDSSTVVAVAQDVSTDPVHTFTVGFDEDSHDESEAAREVARKLGASFTTLQMAPAKLRDVLDRLTWFYDEPFADPSAVPTYHLSAMAREHVTVALSGDGGDEVFAGYDQFLSDRLNPLIRRVPRSITSIIGELLLVIRHGGRGADLKSQLHRIHHQSRIDPSVFRFLSKISIDDAESILSPDLDRTGTVERHFSVLRDRVSRAGSRDAVEELIAAHTLFRLPNDMLVKVDRASMAHSLEVRVPLLDHRVVEFAAGLPSDLKLRRLHTKFLLKETLRFYLPRRLVYKPKRGFGVPISEWFRGDLGDFALEVLRSSPLKDEGIYSTDAVESVIRGHRAGETDRSHLIYAMLMFALWWEHYTKRWQ